MVLFGPNWFLGIDVFLELLFAVITLGIAAYSYRLAQIVKEKNYYHFTAAFLLFSAAYGVRFLVNLIVGMDMIPNSNGFNVEWIHFAGFYLSSIGQIAGVVMLLSTTFSKTRDIRPLLMIFLTSVIGLLFAFNRLIYLWIILSLFFLLICYHYLKTWYHSSKNTTSFVLAAFAFLLVGQINFLFRFGQFFYVVGHVFELMGFIILLLVFYRISRK